MVGPGVYLSCFGFLTLSHFVAGMQSDRTDFRRSQNWMGRIAGGMADVIRGYTRLPHLCMAPDALQLVELTQDDEQ